MQPSAGPCTHTGTDRCPQCTWSRPGQAVALVLRGRTAHTALPIALVVGIVLSAVNQGYLIADGPATAGTWIRVAVNFLVPYVVASIGCLSGRRRPDPDTHP